MIVGVSSTVFLLSPAYCGGRRAKMLLREGSSMPLAVRLAEGTLPLGDAFTFMSGLYFRGKIAYAKAFGRRVDPGPAAFVITPTRGLQPPDVLIDREVIEEFAALDVAHDEPRYRDPLVADARKLANTLAEDARIVLLGSVATAKYLEVVADAFQSRLCFPSAFIGRGDMSRGGLMLRSADSGQELEYMPFSSATTRHGPRPPKLAPLKRVVRRPEL
jgi:hypothetical protein